MSYDEQDAAYDRFIDELYKEFRDSALDDAELYDKIVDDFKASRLRGFYADHPFVAQTSGNALEESISLATDHPRAALVLAVTAAEVCLREALLTPILHGMFHTESSAELVVRRVVTVKDEKLFKALIRVLSDHTDIDLQSFVRPGSRKPLWEEMRELQVKRNQVLHQATTVPIEDARHAIAIAKVLLREVFPTVITKLGLHLHEGGRVCDSPKCSTM